MSAGKGECPVCGGSVDPFGLKFVCRNCGETLIPRDIVKRATWETRTAYLRRKERLDNTTDTH